MMLSLDLVTMDLDLLRDAFGERLLVNVPLRRFTSARVGGLADAFLEARTSQELVEAATSSWEQDIPLIILGGGSNVLVSDSGVRGLVVLNRARQVRFYEQAGMPVVWAESGTYFGLIARLAGQQGLAGLEWAAGIPGTLGGAVVGNAGAHGGDMAGSLLLAEILHHKGSGHEVYINREEWSVEKLEYNYRSSILKRLPGGAMVLSAVMRLERSTPEAVLSRIDELTTYRKRTQPPGASMGSMFKNPPGDYAGRLIEAAGLKGTQVGGAMISPLHGNFFINTGEATARNVFDLIQLAEQAVFEKFGVSLELEIELLGEW
jgi:UDP-N-acetylmuramate dehydrogenase